MGGNTGWADSTVDDPLLLEGGGKLVREARPEIVTTGPGGSLTVTFNPGIKKWGAGPEVGAEEGGGFFKDVWIFS